MSTLGDMKTRIADELVNEAITSTQIDKAIKTAIKHYEREGFWFNQKVGTLTTVAAQELYTSSDMADIASMVRVDAVQVGSTKKPVKGVTYDSIDDLQDGSVTGEPEYYTRYADKLRFYPIPDAAYTVTMSYIVKLAELTDNDSNAWVDECEELTRNAAKRILCVDVLNDSDMAGPFAEIERVAYTRVRRENRERQPQKTLRPDIPPTYISFNVYRG